MIADSTSDAVAGLGGLTLLFLVLCAALYFVPVIVAVTRKSHLTAAIVVIDVFLGWTMIGWVVALAMAFMRPSVVVALPAPQHHWDGHQWVLLPPGYPPPPPVPPAG